MGSVTDLAVVRVCATSNPTPTVRRFSIDQIVDPARSAAPVRSPPAVSVSGDCLHRPIADFSACPAVLCIMLGMTQCRLHVIDERGVPLGEPPVPATCRPSVMTLSSHARETAVDSVADLSCSHPCLRYLEPRTDCQAPLHDVGCLSASRLVSDECDDALLSCARGCVRQHHRPCWRPCLCYLEFHTDCQALLH